MTTGFNAYHIYNTVKYIYFPGKKYDIIKHQLPRREVFVKKWNNEVINRKDSLYFLNLEKDYTKEQLIRMMSIYYLDNNKFYVTNIFDDEFYLYKKGESDLNNLDLVIETDLLKLLYITKSNNVPISNIFKYKDKIPFIYTLYEKGIIRLNSLVAFGTVTKINNFDNYKATNIIEEEKIKKYKKIFDKYLPIIYNKISNYDLKTLIKHELSKH